MLVLLLVSCDVFFEWESTNAESGTKHYIANEQEHFRQAGEAFGYGFNITESISANIDDVYMTLSFRREVMCGKKSNTNLPSDHSP